MKKRKMSNSEGERPQQGPVLPVSEEGVGREAPASPTGSGLSAGNFSRIARGLGWLPESRPIFSSDSSWTAKTGNA